MLKYFYFDAWTLNNLFFLNISGGQFVGEFQNFVQVKILQPYQQQITIQNILAKKLAIRKYLRYERKNLFYLWHLQEVS